MPLPDRSSRLEPGTKTHRRHEGSDGDCRGETDRRRRPRDAGITGGRDRQPPPPGPEAGHYEVASDRGGQRAAAVYTLIETARLNDVDPRAWIADVLARINDHPASRLDQLLPWNWKAENQTDIAA